MFSGGSGLVQSGYAKFGFKLNPGLVFPLGLVHSWSFLNGPGTVASRADLSLVVGPGACVTLCITCVGVDASGGSCACDGTVPFDDNVST